MIIIPYILMGLGALNIFFGVVSYKKQNKTNAIIMILIGLFIITIAILKII